MLVARIAKSVAFFSLILISVGEASADDLVAAVLPLSRSPQIGHSATAFATVINSSGHAWGGCFATAPNFNGSFSYQTTNSTTNALTGTPNTPFSLTASGAGSSQTMFVAFQSSNALSPTNEPITFKCANSNAAVSIIGVNTLLLSVNSTATPDIVALGATPTADGTLRSSGVGATAAFAVATVNVGAAGTITVTADTGDIQLPVTVSLCQTDPTSGACTNPSIPAASATLSVAANATPTFSFFVTPTGPIPFFPAQTRLFVRFKDGNGVTRGSTSVALNSNTTLAAGQTPGGYYTGVYRITSGPQLGTNGVAQFIVAENGALAGVGFDQGAQSVSAVYTAPAVAPTNALLYTTTGLIANDDGGNSLTINGAVSPRNLIAGLYSYPGQTGEFYAAYNQKIYERASSLSLLAGSWTVRNAGTSIGTATISASGAITGTASGAQPGCTFTGTAGVINASYNAYTVSISTSSACGNFTVTGLGALIDTNATNDTFQIMTADSAGDMIPATLTKF